MTELEQKLLDELERLENEREEEKENIKKLTNKYETNLKKLSESMAREYHQSLTKLIKSENSDQNALVTYLETISSQQRQIIKLLETPPSDDNLSEVLDEALNKFSRELSVSLERSSERLIDELSQLLS